MSNLSILKTSIRTYENLYSLNDLHIASGSEDKHRPTFFVRLETTKELVSEIQKEDPTNPVIICKNGIGTYACEELALAYVDQPKIPLGRIKSVSRNAQTTKPTATTRLART